MADRKPVEIKPEHWDKAESGFKSVIDNLEHAGFDLNTKPKHGLPPPAVQMFGIKIGSRVVFEEVHTVNGEPSLEKIDCVVTGVFTDGFAYRRLRPISDRKG